MQIARSPKGMSTRERWRHFREVSGENSVAGWALDSASSAAFAACSLAPAREYRAGGCRGAGRGRGGVDSSSRQSRAGRAAGAVAGWLWRVGGLRGGAMMAPSP
jgi:hypothetical protein